MNQTTVMSPLMVTAGYFDETGQGSLIELSASGRAQLVLRSAPPEHLHVQGRGFTGGSWSAQDQALYVCGYNAIYRCRPAPWRVDGILHQPCFNDLHHVLVDGPWLYVVNTALERVDRLERETGRFMAGVSLQPSWLEAARQHGQAPHRGGFDALLVAGWSGQAQTLTPDPESASPYKARPLPFHRQKLRDFIHPNSLTRAAHRLALTLFARGEVIDLWTGEQLIAPIGAPIHDGVADGELFWLTTVRGEVLAAQMTEALPWPIVRRLKVSDLSGRFGWCRGLYVGHDFIAVGLTELRRPSRYGWRDDVTLSQTRTQVVWAHKETGQPLGCCELPEPERHSKLYSVLSLSKSGPSS